ncbi:MAG: hypothetical protein NVS3B28_17930 [Candidatus Velthaea sp.]
MKCEMLGAPRSDDELRVIEGSLDGSRFVAGAFAQNATHRIAFYKKMIEARAQIEGLIVPSGGTR